MTCCGVSGCHAMKTRACWACRRRLCERDHSECETATHLVSHTDQSRRHDHLTSPTPTRWEARSSPQRRTDAAARTHVETPAMTSQTRRPPASLMTQVFLTRQLYNQSINQSLSMCVVCIKLLTCYNVRFPCTLPSDNYIGVYQRNRFDYFRLAMNVLPHSMIY